VTDPVLEGIYSVLEKRWTGGFAQETAFLGAPNEPLSDDRPTEQLTLHWTLARARDSLRRGMKLEPCISWCV
jgi:hypothetical protein